MKSVSFIALVFVLLLKADDLAAQNREVVLNYEDPIGADLIVALAPPSPDLRAELGLAVAVGLRHGHASRIAHRA